MDWADFFLGAGFGAILCAILTVVVIKIIVYFANRS